MNVLPAGYFKDRITLLWPTWARGAQFDEQQATWDTTKVVCANVQYNRGVNAITVAESWMHKQIAVTIRYHSSIHDRCRLVWNGQVYRIADMKPDVIAKSIAIVAESIDMDDDEAGTATTTDDECDFDS